MSILARAGHVRLASIKLYSVFADQKVPTPYIVTRSINKCMEHFESAYAYLVQSWNIHIYKKEVVVYSPTSKLSNSSPQLLRAQSRSYTNSAYFLNCDKLSRPARLPSNPPALGASLSKHAVLMPRPHAMDDLASVAPKSFACGSSLATTKTQNSPCSTRRACFPARNNKNLAA